MELSLRNNLNRLQEVLTEEYIKKNYHEVTDIENVAKMNHKIKGFCHRGFSNGGTVISFCYSDYLENELRILTNNSKKEIDEMYRIYTSSQKKSMFKGIELQCNYMERNIKDIKKTFPICERPIKELRNYIKNKYGVNISNSKKTTILDLISAIRI